jgi:DNA repair protein RecO
MHHIHQTKAFILSSFPFGESGKVLNLLTEKFGLIKANAQGIRKVESKLKQSTQELSLSEVVMVYGKQGWILTNAVLLENFFYSFSKEKSLLLAKIFSFLERMIPNEEHDESFFNIIVILIRDLENFENLQNDSKIIVSKINLELTDLEMMTVLKILKKLGYIGQFKELEDYLDSENLDFLIYLNQHRKDIIEIINSSIKESHL